MFKRMILCTALVLVTKMVWAGTTLATIDSILLFDGGNLAYFCPTGGVMDAPACHGSNGNYFSFSMSCSMAKQYLATLLAAQARGASVTFRGKGACLDQSVSQTLDYFSVQ